MSRSLSKQKRFKIFKRDSFTCMYCGQKPPNVTLEVDHIIPVASGGPNTDENLATSCFDCNRGKSDGSLDVIPEALVDTQRRKIEAYEQADALRKMLKKHERGIEESVRKLESDFAIKFTASSKRSVLLFLRKLALDQVQEALTIADGKIGVTRSDGWKYFCGICWKKIREQEGRA